jgi:predicted RNA-binding protein with PUA-like domain
MNYWLVKTEPETFSWDKLEKEGTSMWDGVRNYQARNNLRRMLLKDVVLFYHSGKNPGIIGLAEVVKEHYPDPTAVEGDWSAIDIRPLRKFKRFISLPEIKTVPSLQNMVLLRNTRLSVQPLNSEEFHQILKLEELEPAS